MHNKLKAMEDESLTDHIFNSLNKKDRKDLFVLKNGNLTLNTAVNKDELTKAWRLWSSSSIKNLYNGMSGQQRKEVDQLPFLKRVTKLQEIQAANKSSEDSDIDSDEEEVPEDLIQNNDSSSDEEKESTSVVAIVAEKKKPSASHNQLMFNQIVAKYLQEKPHILNVDKSTELEVRFGTKGSRKLTKGNYDQVVQVLKSFGYVCNDVNGLYTLKMQNEFIGKVSGRAEISNIRVEVQGLDMIQQFCKNNNLKDLMSKHANSVRFLRKTPIYLEGKEKLKPVEFEDFNFRVSCQQEELLSSGRGASIYIISNWKSTKKIFRYVNRVSFSAPDSPVRVDMSLIRSSEFNKTFFTTEDAELFQRPETVEIEIEVDNSKVEAGTDVKTIVEALRKSIKHVLYGLQQTKFPISYPDQKKVQEDYMKLVFDDENKAVLNKCFIGPSSYTLQRINIAPMNPNVIAPNIRKNYTVTDKADGLRHLLYVNETGNIYLINMQMNVIFTGAKTVCKECLQSILDGELIVHDKNGKFINLFAVFDIYYFNKKSVRELPLISEGLRSLELKKEERKMEENVSRLQTLNHFISILKPVSVLPNTPLSPIRIESKQFYPGNPSTDSIFAACDVILGKQREGLFEYNIDGLIFTPAYFGVGGDGVGKVGPLTKTTWDYSFKQKPEKYNTIDFLVTTMKNSSGQDDVKNVFEVGTCTDQPYPLTQYKTIELRVSFVENMHGYLNPCQDIIDENFDAQDAVKSNEPKPVIFYPTSPYDPEAGITNIMMRPDETNTMQMFTEEGDVFTDNTIVEFSYSFEKERGWRWVPLRLRHDKTSELHQGGKNFGNAYHVANSNWQSIHNPITDQMICTGMNIPEIEVDGDIYYNYHSGALFTEGLRNFHNLFIKKNLIKSVAKGGDTLIDFACGKAGDLSKWIAAKLSFVFGIDISKDNLENRLDGACARYLNARKQNKEIPYCLFLNGNSAFNIRNGTAMRDDKAIQITKSIFGEGSDKASVVGKGVARHFGVASEGFNVSSCQFALHYFFKDPETLKGFMRNVAETTKMNGYFVGTAYDGKVIFKMLQKKQIGESVQIVEDGHKVWEVIKQYTQDKFDDTSASLGLQIDVFQESINQLISEYLINFDYLCRVMENYGFLLVDREEARSMGLPESSGLFNEMYSQMMNESADQWCNYGKATQMTETEKKISFLNRYFVFKKIRNVNASKVILDVEDYKPDEIASTSTTASAAASASTKSTQNRLPITKLKRKILLVPSEESAPTEAKAKKAKQNPKKDKKVVQKEENGEKK